MRESTEWNPTRTLRELRGKGYRYCSMTEGPQEGKRIVVTGGAGFIGSHTAVALVEAGYEPVLVDDLRNSREEAVDGIRRIVDREVEWHRVDCGDANAMASVFDRPVHGAIHFAADKAVGESVDQPEKYVDNTIGGTARFTALLRRHKVRHLVFSSSCTVYGRPRFSLSPSRPPSCPPPRRMASPSRPARPCSTRPTRRRGDLGVALLRYFNPIGAHPSAEIGELPLGPPANLVPFLTQAVAGLRGPLTVFGDDYPTPDGTCIRDYLHVCDLAEAHVSALRWLERNEGRLESFNLGTGRAPA